MGMEPAPPNVLSKMAATQLTVLLFNSPDSAIEQCIENDAQIIVLLFATAMPMIIFSAESAPGRCRP